MEFKLSLAERLIQSRLGHFSVKVLRPKARIRDAAFGVFVRKQKNRLLQILRSLYLLRLIFADVSIIQVFWPDTESRESSHSLYLSPVILQGNGRGLPIDLELLDSRGRVGGLHHHACLLVGQGGPLGCEGGLLRGDAPAGGLSVAPRPQTPSVGGRRGC